MHLRLQTSSTIVQHRYLAAISTTTAAMLGHTNKTSICNVIQYCKRLNLQCDPSVQTRGVIRDDVAPRSLNTLRTHSPKYAARAIAVAAS
eukprot:6224-Heterococcus_DN1.PRE.3